MRRHSKRSQDSVQVLALWPVHGAISGAAVVAGLINQDKAGTSQTVRSVMNQFKQQNGTVICKDLKGVETGKVIRSCDDCVRDAVKFLEDALKSEN